MGREFGDLFGSLVGATLICLGLVILAVIVTPLFLLGIAIYIGVRLWLENPARLEALARAETLQLYNHALAGRVLLTTETVETALATHWPSVSVR